MKNNAFEEIDRSLNKVMTPVICPSCNSRFALSDDFLSKVELLNFMFTCPYCSEQYNIKKI